MFAFELLLRTLEAENLSPVVASVAQSVSVAQAVVGPGTITVVPVVGISIGSRLGSSGGLSLSGPLAVVVSVGIGVSVSVCSVAQTVVSCIAQSIGTIGVPWVSSGLGLSLSSGLSRPLAIVSVGVRVTVSIGSVASVGVRVGTIAVSQPWVSLSLRLGLWLTGDEGGKANHKSELHCCLSDQFRIPMYSAL